MVPLQNPARAQAFIFNRNNGPLPEKRACVTFHREERVRFGNPAADSDSSLSLEEVNAPEIVNVKFQVAIRYIPLTNGL